MAGSYFDLFDAIFNGIDVDVSRLLKCGISPNGESQYWDQSPLHYAAQAGRADYVALLLEHGADPCSRNAQLATPLHTAAREGHAAVCARLVEAGASLDAEDALGYTPRETALKHGKHEAAALLDSLQAMSAIRGLDSVGQASPKPLN